MTAIQAGSLHPRVVERLISDALGARGHDAAIVERENHSDGITEFKISPRQIRAAHLVVEVENNGLRAYLTIGRGCLLEIDGTAGAEGQLRDALDAVFAGRFEETVRMRDSEVLGARGRLTIGGRVLRLYYGRLWSTFVFEFLLRSTKVRYQYEAY